MTGVVHAFVSALSDGSDASLVRPSNWNAGHTLENGVLGDQIVGNGATTLERAGFAPGLWNGSLSCAVGSNALTIALKGTDGNDPSATNPVYVGFRNVTAATGTPAVIAVTAATSLVLSNGSTLGTTANTANRLWVVGFNDGGTFRLGAVNCRSGMNVMSLKDDDVRSSTAEGGAGGADTAQVIYTGSAVTSKAMRVLGYLEYSSGLGTAGVYASAPTKVIVYAQGMKLPGDVVQTIRNASSAVATGATNIPQDDSIPQNNEGDQYFSQAITPTATPNLLEVFCMMFFGVSKIDTPSVALFQDSTVDALAASRFTSGAGVGYTTSAIFKHRFLAATTSATTLNIRAGCTASCTLTLNGKAAAREFGGVASSWQEVSEIMA